MESDQYYAAAANQTVINLRSVMSSSMLREMSELSLPEIEKVIDMVAQVVPAGNVPGMILSGLARLSGRQPPAKIVKRDINLLFRGVEQALDKAVYSAVFAGPAAVLWAYQNLLKLVGKDPDAAFPEGTWQFYVDYALREDTARHTNETHGFDTLLNRHHIRLSVVDRITAWVMTAIHCLHGYDALLENEWRERVYLHLLRALTRDLPDAARYAGLYREWEKRRPYGRGHDSAADQTYVRYRRLLFDRFLYDATRPLGQDVRRAWLDRIAAMEAEDLPAYQRQMSILATLDPGPHGETRIPVPLPRAHVGVIHQGHYTLIPACAPGTLRPTEVSTVRLLVANMLAGSSGMAGPAASLMPLAQVRREALPDLREKLNRRLGKDLDTLQTAPILLNFDLRPRYLPLSEVRQAERGVGDHPLTVFDTGETFVFDQSHIFFDGTWGAALAEILTNEAMAWSVYLHNQPPVQPTGSRPQSLALDFKLAEIELIEQAPHVTPEVSAENDRVDLAAMQTLRKVLLSRNAQLHLTVNDLLVLYRAIHAVTYRPSPDLVGELQRLARPKATRQAARTTLEALDSAGQTNAVILIPVDASLRNPRDRLHPMTFEVPLAELELLELHDHTKAALDAYKRAAGPDRGDLYVAFDRNLRRYLAMLAGFGAVFGKTKEIAATGESASVGTIKLLAYLPTPLQRLLDKIPHQIDMLYDMIKGREVFSNVGAVAPSSTLIRFTTAKDDNDKKSLVWGVITDSAGIMHVSLRDFRPHVALLQQIGRRDLAARIVQDYLDAYAHGLNAFIDDLHRMILANRSALLELNLSSLPSP